ncbi:hypothetical protein GGR02_003026 [Anoxybacillus voinovskiensis]|uniref:Uncharacterized protein n=1 Tax=Anoxybacteroides voinovskiense TaxID=230470 RepID=A0A840E0E1_9BACL|nr:hypothetical protein [Anoxybacillus voinovskiensis]MBB4075209.1 hypothetical protein [Anoxybacillus voinovskiensis]GGJ77150.1 hypothetical protein GCM10008982_28140 [Anoxybacillus voinovskiensis]
MNRLDLLFLQVSNIKLNLLEQQMITRDVKNELKRLERYIQTKEEK